MELVTSTIIKYIVEGILALICGAIAFFVKRYINFEKKERKREQQEYREQIKAEIKTSSEKLVKEVMKKSTEGDQQLQQQVNDLKTELDNTQNKISAINDETSALKAGMLSMQGKEFRASCSALLEENHVITLDEWEEIDADHEAYNRLGGNHKGDSLFELVKKKFENSLL